MNVIPPSPVPATPVADTAANFETICSDRGHLVRICAVRQENWDLVGCQPHKAKAVLSDSGHGMTVFCAHEIFWPFSPWLPRNLESDLPGVCLHLFLDELHQMEHTAPNTGVGSESWVTHGV